MLNTLHWLPRLLTQPQGPNYHLPWQCSYSGLQVGPPSESFPFPEALTAECLALSPAGPGHLSLGILQSLGPQPYRPLLPWPTISPQVFTGTGMHLTHFLLPFWNPSLV